MKCCYCKKTIQGEVQYSIPEGYPRDPRNDGRPLCAVCGGGPTPTLDEICWALDEELADRRLRVLLGTVAVVVVGIFGGIFGGIVFGPWGLLACPGLGLLGVVFLHLLGAVFLHSPKKRCW